MVIVVSLSRRTEVAVLLQKLWRQGRTRGETLTGKNERERGRGGGSGRGRERDGEREREGERDGEREMRGREVTTRLQHCWRAGKEAVLITLQGNKNHATNIAGTKRTTGAAVREDEAFLWLE